MLADLKSALRTQAKTPVISSIIVLSLALGIGTNTVIFSWLRTVAFEPVSGVTAEVFAVEQRNAAGAYVGTSWLDFRDLRERLPSFAALMAHRPQSFYLG